MWNSAQRVHKLSSYCTKRKVVALLALLLLCVSLHSSYWQTRSIWRHEQRPVRVSYVTSVWAEPRDGTNTLEKNNTHRREIEAALLVNIRNPYLDQIVVFLDGVAEAGTNCDDFLRDMRKLGAKIDLATIERVDPFSKVTCVDIPGAQPNYFQMFNITLHDAVLGDIIVLANADQVFDDSISIARDLNPNVLIVLGTNGFSLDEVPPIIQKFYVTLVGDQYLNVYVKNMCANNPFSWDTWIFDRSVLRGGLKEEHFQRPLADNKMMSFSMNEMGAENAALWALQQTFPFISLYNACDKIKSWDFHRTPKMHKVQPTPWLCGGPHPCGSVPYPWGGVPLKGEKGRMYHGVSKDPECAQANNCFLQESRGLTVENAMS
ncbi:hypothetical protein ACHAW6_011119 [Cyclotella cf. meneghiniana]